MSWLHGEAGAHSREPMALKWQSWALCNPASSPNPKGWIRKSAQEHDQHRLIRQKAIFFTRWTLSCLCNLPLDNPVCWIVTSRANWPQPCSHYSLSWGSPCTERERMGLGCVAASCPPAMPKSENKYTPFLFRGCRNKIRTKRKTTFLLVWKSVFLPENVHFYISTWKSMWIM